MQPQMILAVPNFGPPPEPEPDNYIPSRVLVALKILDAMTAKTDHTVAVGALSIERFDGQKLSLEEDGLSACACDLLQLYLRGQLKPDAFEKVKKDKPAIREGVTLPCPNCQGRQSSCQLCHGCGSVFVAPNKEPK